MSKLGEEGSAYQKVKFDFTIFMDVLSRKEILEVFTKAKNNIRNTRATSILIDELIDYIKSVKSISSLVVRDSKDEYICIEYCEDWSDNNLTVCLSYLGQDFGYYEQPTENEYSIVYDKRVDTYEAVVLLEKLLKSAGLDYIEISDASYSDDFGDVFEAAVMTVV